MLARGMKKFYKQLLPSQPQPLQYNFKWFIFQIIMNYAAKIKKDKDLVAIQLSPRIEVAYKTFEAILHLPY